MLLGLQGKVVLCTGAAGGISRPTARMFAQEGARVVCVDCDQAALDELAASLPGQGHLAMAANLDGQAAAEQAVARALAECGRVDVLAHLAAVLHAVDIGSVTEEDWNEHLRVNVTAAFFIARAAAESMKLGGQGGAIILMTSGAWLTGGMPTRLPYATTKGAVTTMTRSLAKAYGPHAVTVNSIAPGLVDTPMMRFGLTPAQRAEMEQATPLRRFGTPEEIASVVVFLASSQASFVSGATINVPGGYTLY